MLKIMDILFSEKQDLRDSIYTHVKNHINPKGPGLLPGGEILPDDEAFNQQGVIGFVPGSLDVLAGNPSQIPMDKLNKKIEEFIEALRKASREPAPETLDRLETLMKTPETLALIDNVLRRMVTDQSINQAVLYRICRHLFFRSRHRGVVKFCISIMGLFGIKGDLDLFKTISRHPEFTLYSAVAVMFPDRDACRDIWLDMATNVDGWGRVHLINRLADLDNSKVKEFLLKEGCRNEYMAGYTALTIAEAVGLEKILERDEIDEETFTGAGVLLRAMAESIGDAGPFMGIQEYREAPIAVREYLRHSVKMARSAEDYLALKALLGITDPEKLHLLKENRWDSDTIDLLKSEAASILKRESWKDVIRQGLRHSDFKGRRLALLGASDFKDEMADEIATLLDSNPLMADMWVALMQDASDEALETASELAYKKLVKERPAFNGKLTDPRKELCDSCLEAVISCLYESEDAGMPLMKEALSGKHNNRIILQALRVLHRRDRFRPGPDILEILRGLAADEEPMISVACENLLKKAELLN